MIIYIYICTVHITHIAMYTYVNISICLNMIMSPIPNSVLVLATSNVRSRWDVASMRPSSRGVTPAVWPSRRQRRWLNLCWLMMMMVNDG